MEQDNRNGLNENLPEDQQPEKNKQSDIALASLIMGIIGLVTSCCCGGIVCGSLGILFALLSKTEEKFEKYAKIGLITSILSFVISIIAIIGFAAFIIIQRGDF